MNLPFLIHNQKGVSSLVLLLMLGLGVFILWEANEYIRLFNNPLNPPGSTTPGGPVERFCATGEEGNCNDSNDQFIFGG